jgi:hypothetical protein
MTDSESAVVFLACELVDIRTDMMNGTAPAQEAAGRMGLLMERLAEAVDHMYDSWLAEDEDEVD